MMTEPEAAEPDPVAGLSSMFVVVERSASTKELADENPRGRKLRSNGGKLPSNGVPCPSILILPTEGMFQRELITNRLKPDKEAWASQSAKRGYAFAKPS